MADTSLPDASPGSSGEVDGKHSVCATLESLRVQDATPKVGDTVDITVQGSVTRIEGDNAYITPDKVNGQDVPAEAKDETVTPTSEDDLANKAAELDAQSGY